MRIEFDEYKISRSFIKLEIKCVIPFYISLVVSEFEKTSNKDLRFINYKGTSIKFLLSSSLLEFNSAVRFYYYYFTFFYTTSLLRIAISVFIVNTSNSISIIRIFKRRNLFLTLVLKVLIYFNIT